MRLFKKNTNKIEHSVIARRIRKEWNPSSASAYYILEEADENVYTDGTVRHEYVRTIYGDYERSGPFTMRVDGWKTLGSGNLEWAARNAEHYDLELPS